MGAYQLAANEILWRLTPSGHGQHPLLSCHQFGCLAMTNKRIIWLALSLVLCLFGGGLYYSMTVKTFPCKISCVNDSILSQLRFSLNYNFLVSKLREFAADFDEPPANWHGVEVRYVDKNPEYKWTCSIYKANQASKELSFEIYLKENGHFEICTYEPNKSLSR